MHRRNLLKGMTAIAALQAVALPASLSFAAGAKIFRRVRPSDPAWPKPEAWKKLNDAVGGNLIEVKPPFDACAKDAKSATCHDTLSNFRNPFFLGDQPGGTQVSGWLDAWTSAASAYAVKVRNASDVAAAVNFAREKKLRLVVKGTGHSYLGTSNAPDSLLIWTHGMNDVALHDAFVPQGGEGKVAPVPAVTAGAGCMWIDLYTAVTTKAGRYVQGGGCTDVGVAGLVQSGGFGSFSKGFGTAAAGLLEAEIVTADGQVRIANATTNPDLFWALKGGGGGSWGVVTKLTLRTHELPKYLGGAWGKIKAVNDDAFRRLLLQFVGFYRDNLMNPHWGEEVHIAPDNTFEISMVNQGLSKPEAKAIWLPFFDWIAASPKDYTVTDELGASGHDGRDWWDTLNNPSMTRDMRPGAPNTHAWWKGDQDQVGICLYGYDSLWLPASLLSNDNGKRLADALFAGSRYQSVGLHINKGLAGAPPEAIAATLDTATNPRVTGAFALALIANGGWPQYPGFPIASPKGDDPHKVARLVDLATAELRKIAPNSGSYVSESNYFNANWQQEYWGENYSRLRAVKAKYDPEGLFFVHHGVGSEDWSPDGFTRLV